MSTRKYTRARRPVRQRKKHTRASMCLGSHCGLPPETSLPTLLEQIGKGGHGDVYKAMWDGFPVAVKKIRKGMRRPGAAKNEIKALHSLRHHPHILTFYGSYISEGCAHIITEVVPDGDLLQHVLKRGKLNEMDAKDIFKGMIDALAHMHAVV